jgi:pimeloyl-ACP methyl ester carboxylesterase
MQISHLLSTPEKTSAPSEPEQRRGEECSQQSEYLNFNDAQLYLIVHSPSKPCRGHVLLAGPFASARNDTFVPWIRWARFLANNGYEVVRFDYRGVGESSGTFEEMTFSKWLEDLRACAAWVQARAHSRPILLHGLEAGGLLAANAFAQGLGHALLLWSPPASARDLLLERLRFKLFSDYTLSGGTQRRVREDYIRDLESGTTVEVYGYRWSPELWKQSASLLLPSLADLAASRPNAQRLCRTLQLDPSLKPLTPGVSGTRAIPLTPDTTSF